MIVTVTLAFMTVTLTWWLSEKYKILILERLENNSILDQDFFDVPRLELEIIGHLASILRWQDLTWDQSSLLDDVHITQYIDIMNPIIERQYVNEVHQGSKSPTTRYQMAERYKRLRRRKQTYDVLCILQNVVQRTVDNKLGQTDCRDWASTWCGAILPRRILMDYQSESLTFNLLKNDVQLEPYEVKWLRRSCLLMYVSCFFLTHGTPSETEITELHEASGWIQPVVKGQTDKIISRMEQLFAELHRVGPRP